MPVVSSYTSINGTDLADGDDFLVVDVSDHTQAVTGTTKRVTKSELASVMGNDPSTLSRLAAKNLIHLGNHSDDDPNIGWDTAAGEVVGTDITLDVDTFTIRFVTAGVYSINAWVNVQTSGDKFTNVGALAATFTPALPATGFYSTGIFSDAAGNFDSVGFAFQFCYFLPAGSTAVFDIFAETLAASDWDLPSNGVLYVQRMV